MQPNLTVHPRASGYTVSRASGYGLGEVEEAATRLKSWAVIMGIPITGPAFVRLSSDLAAFVHLPIDRAVDTSVEDGISAETMPDAQVVEGRDVTFDEMRTTATALRNEAEQLGNIAGHAEYHAGPDGMRRGTKVPRYESRATGPPLRVPRYGSPVTSPARRVPRDARRRRGALSRIRRAGL